jgi:hypothetical protein
MEFSEKLMADCNISHFRIIPLRRFIFTVKNFFLAISVAASQG